MKKFVSIIFALTMVLALNIFAAADTSTKNGTTTVNVIADYGDPTAEWTIPPSVALSENNSYTDDVSISITKWKAEPGARWELGVDETITVSSEDGSTLNVTAVITDGNFSVNADTTDVESVCKVSVTATDPTTGVSEHLAGSKSFSGTLNFTLSYMPQMS